MKDNPVFPKTPCRILVIRYEQSQSGAKGVMCPFNMVIKVMCQTYILLYIEHCDEHKMELRNILHDNLSLFKFTTDYNRKYSRCATKRGNWKCLTKQIEAYKTVALYGNFHTV